MDRLQGWRLPIKTALVTPDVTQYLDYRQFLNDYYAFRKTSWAAFSYQVWAEELGFKDRSFLRMIITGRRALSESNKIKFLNKINFDEIQKHYFSHLVSYNCASEPAVKSYHSERMRGLLKLRVERREIDILNSSHAEPRLMVLSILLGYEDIKKDSHTLAEVLKENPAQVEEWLKILKENSIVTYDNNSAEWKPLNKSLKISDSPGSPVLSEFHRRSLQHAKDCVDLESSERKFRSLIVALNKTQLENLWKNFGEFALETLAELEGQPLADRKLYQINFNCVPAARVHPNTNKQIEADSI